MNQILNLKTGMPDQITKKLLLKKPRKAPGEDIK